MKPYNINKDGGRYNLPLVWNIMLKKRHGGQGNWKGGGGGRRPCRTSK